MRSLLSRALLALGLALAPAALTVPQLRAAIHAPSPALLRGARVVRTGTQAATNNTTTCVSWTSASFDTGAYWSAGTPDRLTYTGPSTYVELTGMLEWASVTGRRDIQLRKNASVVAWQQSPTSSAAYEGIQTISTGPLAVASGDYFELCGWQGTGGSVNMNALGAVYFTLKVLQ